MAAPQLWCVSTSHPLVHQIAKKYNITVRDAKDIYNVARENDSELRNDSVTLSRLEQSQAFQDAISAYSKSFIDADKALLDRVIGDQKIEDTIREQIRDELGIETSDEEIEQMASAFKERASNALRSRISTADIVALLRSFKDGRRLDFLGNWVCRQMSAIVNAFELDPKMREEYGVPTKTRRQDYYADSTDVIKDFAISYLEEAEENCRAEGKIDLADELKATIDYFDVLLFMYGGLFFRNEGVSFDMNGNSTMSEETEEEQTEDENDDDENRNIEEKPVGSFSVSDQNKSVSTKLQGPVKTLLAGLTERDRNGLEIVDQYGYGLRTFVSVPTVTNQILSMCKGCETFSEMMNALLANQEAYPWLEQLIGALDTDDAMDASGTVEVSQSKKEQLQSQFFQSFRKQFTRFRHSYIQYDEDGNMYFVDVDSNTDHRSDRMLRALRRKFISFSGMDILSGGVINFDRIQKFSQELESPVGRIRLDDNSVEGQLRRALSLAVQNAEDRSLGMNTDDTFKAPLSALTIAEKHLQSILKSFGIDASDNLMNTYLNSGDSDVALSSVFGNNKAYGNDSFARRYNNLSLLFGSMRRMIDELKQWKDAQDAGLTNDTPRTNPFSTRRTDRSDYDRIRFVRRKYVDVIELLCSASPDSFESFARMNGKDYYSWNNPSSIQTIVEKLQKKNREETQKYIDDKYGKDALWFVRKDPKDKRGTHFYSDWLDEIYNSNGGDIIEYSEKPMFCGKEYTKLNDTSYALSILNDYFSTKGTESNLAWYRMLIASDKPRYSCIRYKKYNDNSINQDNSWTEDNYHSIIARKALDFFAQEIIRSNEVIHHALKRDMTIDNYDPKITEQVEKVLQKIKNKQKVLRTDVLDAEGRYIFRNTGVSFFLNKFINDEIENESSALGAYVIDKVFNSDISGKTVDVIDGDIVRPFKKAFANYMNSIKLDFIHKLDESGMFDQGIRKVTDPNSGRTVTTTYAKYIYGSLLQWHSDDDSFVRSMYGREDEMHQAASILNIDVANHPEHETYLYQVAQFFRDLEEFVYNNWLAKANMSEIFDIDLAFYGTTPNFQKRNAQVISSGYTADPDAKIHGKPVSDGHYRSITLKTDLKNKSQHLENIRVALTKAADTITDPQQRERYLESMEDTLSKLDGFDATDGQAVVGLTSLRKRMAGQGEWSRSETSEMDDAEETMTDEAVYRRWKKGKTTIDDLMHVFAQAQKPFVYSAINAKRSGARKNITFPVQHKNSEYALCFLSAFSNSALNSQMEAISRFLEETAEEDDTHGIDTVNFDSDVKIGNTSSMIDISGLSPQETIEKLREAVYGKNPETDELGRKKYTDGVVTEYDVTDYKIQQVKNEHFKRSAQPMGSQLKILAINNINDNSVLTMPDGKSITGKELKRRYFRALYNKMQKTERDFRRELGLDSPRKDRLHKLSNSLKSAMATDSKFSVEMRHALSIIEKNGEDQFALPLDEPGIQSAVESMLYSKIRKTFYREKTNGGIVVQATSWGASEDLGIRFYSSNPEDKDGLIPKKKEFGKRHNLTGAKLDREYKKYLDKYQTGYAYMEIEAPMPGYIRDMLLGPDGKVEAKYINPDGTWNMEEIKKTVPESAFDAICYRVPTEAKYSVMICKIVRFSPEASGSVAKYPQELTVFTGSDFDIDTDTVELRPIPGSRTEAEDEELFNLQLTALRSNQGVLETFKSGDFSDLSELSYFTTLLETGNYSIDELKQMSKKELKKRCEQVEDLDLMNPVTDLTLRYQNADASDMIAIAAVGVTSHAFISLYNDIDKSDPSRDPDISPENFVRIRFKTGSDKTNNESFTVVNDINPNAVAVKHIGNNPEASGNKDEVILDAVYDMDGKLIGTEISKYVGGSADAAKDAALARLNINTRTLPILITMHRLGISSDVARMFLKQPVIKQVVAALNSSSPFGYSSLEDACDKVRDQLRSTYTGTDAEFESEIDRIKHATDSELVYSELLDNINHPKEQSLDSKLRQLWIFETLAQKQRMIRNLDSFTRYNSSAAMRGSSFLERYAKRASVQKLMNNLLKGEKATIQLPKNVEILPGFMPNEYGRLCSMFPYIAYTINGEDQLTDRIILENMKTYNPAFFAVAKQLGIEDDADAMKALYGGWKNYLLFAGPNRIADFWNRDVVRKYTKDFAQHYAEVSDRLEKEDPEFFKELTDNNSFIASIGFKESKNDYDEFYLLDTNITGISGQALEQYKKDWAALLDYPQTRQLAIDLGIHFLARSASFDRSTPVHVMPLAIKEAIPNYIEAFANAGKVSMDTFDTRNFLKAFARNNADNRKIVPHLGRETNNDIRYNEQTGKIEFPKKYLEKISSRYLMNGEEMEDDAKTLRFRCPVIQITNTQFPKGQLFIVDSDFALDEREGEAVYSAEAYPTSPLGIPNQFMEYVGFSEEQSVFQEDQILTSADGQDDFASFQDPYFDDDRIILGNRAGTFLEESPYGDIDGNVDKYLARDSYDRDIVERRSAISKEEFGRRHHLEGKALDRAYKKMRVAPYLESREFLKRSSKLANAFGFTLTSSQRGYVGATPTYAISISPSEFNVDQHENAMKVAALMAAFNPKSRVPSVKTYITKPMENFDGIEFTIKLNDFAFENGLEHIRTYAKGLHLPFFINSDTKELQITLDVSKFEDAQEILKFVREKTDAIKKFMDIALGKHGMLGHEEIEVNYVKLGEVDPAELDETLTEIRNEAYENEQESSGQNQETRRSSGRNENWKPVRISDIAELARKKARGEKVDDEVRLLFNERPSPLRNTDASFLSATIADRVTSALSDDVAREMSDLFYSETGNLSDKQLTERLIINAANWILGHRSEEGLMEMMQKVGLKEESGKSIIDVINKILKDLDIC